MASYNRPGISNWVNGRNKNKYSVTKDISINQTTPIAIPEPIEKTNENNIINIISEEETDSKPKNKKQHG